MKNGLNNKISSLRTLKLKSFKKTGALPALALDLGRYQLKLLQLENKNSKLSCCFKQALVPPASLFENGALKDPLKLAGLLKAVKSESKNNTRVLNICLGPGDFYLAHVHLPRMNKKNLQKALCLEVEKRFSLNHLEAAFSWCPAKGKNRAGKQDNFEEYILAAALKEQVLALKEAAFSAGFKKVAIEPRAFSLLRLPFREREAENGYYKKCSLLIDIGHLSSSFIICKNGYFCYYRNLPYGAPFSQQTAPSLHNKMIGLNSLLAEIEQSLRYWLEKPENSLFYPEKLYLSGGGAYYPGLAQNLGNLLNLKPQRHRPVAAQLHYPDTKRATGPEEAIFAACYGLALKE